MPPSLMAGPRVLDLEDSRLGVLYFLSRLQVDFLPEEEKSRRPVTPHNVRRPVVANAAQKVTRFAESVEQLADKIAGTILHWLVERFHVPRTDAELAVSQIRYRLLELLFDAKEWLADFVKDVVDDSGATDVLSGLARAVKGALEAYNLQHAGKGVALESGHPDIVAASIQRSVVRSALVGLGEAVLGAVKAAFAAATAGAGMILNEIALLIEKLIRYAVRLCDALSLKRILSEARALWQVKDQPDAIQGDINGFARWFKTAVDRSPVVAALVMNCGVAGDAMRFLQMVTASDVIVTQGQFDKGVTYLNALKASAGDLVVRVQEDMRIWSTDRLVASLLTHAGEIGLVQREAGSSWRAKIYGTCKQNGLKGKRINWVLNKLGFKQSTPLGRPV